jgi:hypothetical protein
MSKLISSAASGVNSPSYCTPPDVLICVPRLPPVICMYCRLGRGSLSADRNSHIRTVATMAYIDTLHSLTDTRARDATPTLYLGAKNYSSIWHNQYLTYSRREPLLA